MLKQAFADLLAAADPTPAQDGLRRPDQPWFRDELKDELRGVLLDPVCLNRGLFRPETVRQLIDEHIEGRREHSFRLWALLMLELWFRKHLDEGSAEACGDDYESRNGFCLTEREDRVEESFQFRARLRGDEQVLALKDSSGIARFDIDASGCLPFQEDLVDPMGGRIAMIDLFRE